MPFPLNSALRVQLSRRLRRCTLQRVLVGCPPLALPIAQRAQTRSARLLPATVHRAHSSHPRARSIRRLPRYLEVVRPRRHLPRVLSRLRLHPLRILQLHPASRLRAPSTARPAHRALQVDHQGHILFRPNGPPARLPTRQPRQSPDGKVPLLLHVITTAQKKILHFLVKAFGLDMLLWQPGCSSGVQVALRSLQKISLPVLDSSHQIVLGLRVP